MVVSNAVDREDTIIGEIVEFEDQESEINKSILKTNSLLATLAIAVSIITKSNILNTILLSILLVISILTSRDKCVTLENNCNTNIN